MASKSESALAVYGRATRASARLQWLTTVRAPEHLSTLATTPLWTALYVVVLAPGDAFAPFAAALIGVWQVTVNVASGVIENEKWQGTLELAFGSALPYWCILVGRVAAFAPLFVVVTMEALLTNAILTGRWALPTDLPTIAIAMFLAAIGSLGTAILLGPLFLRVRNGPVVSTALTFPLLILGGFAIPSADLPGALAPLSRVFFLSWVTELIRGDTAGIGSAGSELLFASVAVLVLAAASTAIGLIVLTRTERLMLRRGTREFL